LHPHKNHEALLRAFAEDEDLPGPVWPLVLRGDGTERLLEAIASLGLERRVNLLPPLDAAEMPLLYSAAGGLVFPSLFEGGGIPVLEAMASGCPVVASDIPTTREFGGDAVLLFPPTDVAAMRSALHRVEASPQLRDSLRQRGLGQAARSGSGSTIARACLTAYAAAWQGYSANASRRLGGAVARR
jgi:glycosyltransferase involved in cell wall biosynthesis